MQTNTFLNERDCILLTINHKKVQIKKFQIMKRNKINGEKNYGIIFGFEINCAKKLKGKFKILILHTYRLLNKLND